MFLNKYVNEFYYDLILENYDEEFLKTLDEYNFLLIYKLFESYKFYYIDDIIYKYLEIFTMDYKMVNDAIKLIEDKLGENFVYKIGNDMKYLNEILNYES